MSIINGINHDGELSKRNTQAYTPTGDYNPATKKYVDDLIDYVISSLQSKFYGDDLYNFIVYGKYNDMVTPDLCDPPIL